MADFPGRDRLLLKTRVIYLVQVEVVMLIISPPSVALNKAQHWFDNQGPGALILLQKNSGVFSIDVAIEKYCQAWEKVFHCKIILEKNKLIRIKQLEFEDEKYHTWFLLKWV